MEKVKINLEILMDKEAPERLPKKTAEEKVKEWIEDVESGRPSRGQWCRLRRLFNCLANSKKLSPRGRLILEMIEPVMQKYGLMDSKGVDLQATYPFEREKDNQ
jgi:hypothetical protein